MTFGSAIVETLNLRSSDDVKAQLKMEWAMVVQYFPLLLVCFVFQILHSMATNLVFMMEAKQLHGAERLPLHDMGFALLPDISRSEWAAVSEYLTAVMFATLFGMILHTLICDISPRKSAVVLARRYLICVCVLQALRIASFLVTLLPGPAAHCRPLQDTYTEPKGATPTAPWSTHANGAKEFTYEFKDSMYDDFYARSPQNWKDVMFSMDATTGCGDLMFSSHTIFSMSTVCLVFMNYEWALRIFAVVVQLVLAPLIIASRKHYTLDVLTSLYATPLVWFVILKLVPDPPVEREKEALGRGGASYQTLV